MVFSSLNLSSAMCCVHVRVRAATIVKLVLWSILSFTWKEVIVRLRLGAELLCLWLVNTALLDWVGRLVSDVVSQLSVWRSVSPVGISLVSSLTCGFSERWVAELHSVSSTIDNIQFCISIQPWPPIACTISDFAISHFLRKIPPKRILHSLFQVSIRFELLALLDLSAHGRIFGQRISAIPPATAPPSLLLIEMQIVKVPVDYKQGFQ